MHAHTHIIERAYSALLSLSLSSSLSVHAPNGMQYDLFTFFPNFFVVFVFTLPFYPYSHYTPFILSLFLQFISHFHSLSLHYCLFAAFLLSLDYVLARFVHGPRLGRRISALRVCADDDFSMAARPHVYDNAKRRFSFEMARRY